MLHSADIIHRDVTDGAKVMPKLPAPSVCGVTNKPHRTYDPHRNGGLAGSCAQVGKRGPRALNTHYSSRHTSGRSHSKGQRRVAPRQTLRLTAQFRVSTAFVCTFRTTVQWSDSDTVRLIVLDKEYCSECVRACVHLRAYNASWHSVMRHGVRKVIESLTRTCTLAIRVSTSSRLRPAR
jgi:hypothetical protein